VGVENERAINLYKKLGYVDSGFGEFEVNWDYFDKGEEKSEGETCIYLVKELK
jgi:ribosomal protein S18 acetylase RimI-like enzyme